MDGYLDQLALGGLVFMVGLAYAWRQGYVGLSGRGLLNLIILLSGLLFFATVQGYLQYAPMTVTAPTPYQGQFERKEVLGTALDYGISVCLAIGVVFTAFTKTVGPQQLKGLVWGTVADAIRNYKGAPGNEFSFARALATARLAESTPGHEPVS